MRIGLLSDTHGWLDPTLLTGFFSDVDEVWHAGDIGNMEVVKQISLHKPLVAVSGNIDTNTEMGRTFPSEVLREINGVRIFMIHIGGYPGKYPAKIKTLLELHKPDLFICGHSHILRIMPDKNLKLLHINPGACGREGFHIMRTAVRFTVDSGKISQLEVIELGKRGAM
jgi:putative phosphoesterase